LSVFETGAELRKLAQDDSELGQKIKAIIEAGNLVPNEVVMEIIENFMHKLPEGSTVLFDGIPRKMEQAETFDTLMTRLGRDFKGILIEISEEVAMQRLTTRRICEKCKEVYPAKYEALSCEKCGGTLVTRQDDNADAIKTRITAYTDETMPVIKKYESKGKIIRVNGEQDIQEVDTELEKALKQILS